MAFPKNIKKDFPFFEKHPGVVYLDSSSTTQKPNVVIDALKKYYEHENANPGRCSYSLADALAKEVKRVREHVRAFINAKDAGEILFTSGATDSFNKSILSFALHSLEDGDEILYCPSDHISFIAPWFTAQKLLKKQGVHITLVPFRVNETGTIDTTDLVAKVTAKTKVINLTHIHNSFGTKNCIRKIRELVDRTNILMHVDASQSIGHTVVDVQKMGADILSFSGHKMFAAQGIGVTYITLETQKKMYPIVLGGGKGVSLIDEKLSIQHFQQAFESGSLHAAGIISLGKAIAYIESLGVKNIQEHIASLTTYLIDALKEIQDVEFAYGPYYAPRDSGMGIVSFFSPNVPAEVIGQKLAEKGIYVREGDHCMSVLGEQSDTVRISMHVYNDEEDIKKLVAALRSISK